MASSLNLLAAVAVFLALARRPRVQAAPLGPSSAATQHETTAKARARLAVDCVLYGATGAAALALEVVYFRLIDGIMRSNSYTFAHVLTLYLIFFGAGAATAGRRAERSSSPDLTFLWIQFWIGATSLLGVLALLNVPSLFGMRSVLDAYFVGEGYTYGLETPSDFGRR